MPGNEGAPQAPTTPEQERTPETDRISSERIGLTTRLLLGEAALNPAKKDIPEVKKEQLKDDNVEVAADKVINLSKKERSAYWEAQEEKDFEKQKTLWADQVTDRLTKKLTTVADSEKETWKAAYKSIGLEGDITKEKMLEIYKYMFTGTEEQPPVKIFVDLVIKHNTTSDGKIDYKQLQKEMPAIAYLANILGEDTAKILPYLIEAKLAFGEDESEIQDEIVRKANKKNNNQTTSRVNNLTAEEDRLLKRLLEIDTTTEGEETLIISRDKATKIRSEVIDRINANKTDKITAPDGEKLTYKEAAQRLMDLTTGEPLAEIIKLDSDYKDLLEKIKNDPETEFSDEDPTLILSPTLLNQIDLIATESNRINKELAFSIKGVSVKKGPRRDVFFGGLAVADIDFTKAEKEESTPVMSIQERNLNGALTQTHLKDIFAGERLAGGGSDGQLFQVHIHHLGLTPDNIEKPSSIDWQAEKEALSKPLDIQPVGSTFNWGIVTKLATGELSFMLIESTKRANNEITRRVAKVIPIGTAAVQSQAA